MKILMIIMNHHKNYRLKFKNKESIKEKKTKIKKKLKK